MASSSVLDVTAAANAGAAVSAVAGPTATTAQADELAIAAIAMAGSHGGIISVSDSFTLEDDGLTGGVASKILAATGTPQTTFTWTTSRGWATAIATFKAAAAGAAQTISPTGVASAGAFTSPTMTASAVSVSPTAIASGELVGTAAVSPGPVTITTVGVASAEAFGTVFLGAASQVIGTTGIAPAQGFGAPAILTEAAASTARVQAPTPASSTGTTSISLPWNQITAQGNFLVAALAVRAIAGDSIVTPPSGWLHSGRVEAGANVHLDVFTIENAASRAVHSRIGLYWPGTTTGTQNRFDYLGHDSAKSVQRIFYTWGETVASRPGLAAALAAGRHVIVSLNPSGGASPVRWEAIVAGTHDAYLDQFMADLNALLLTHRATRPGLQLRFALHHEPEDNLDTQAVQKSGTAIEFRQMQRRTRLRKDTYAPNVLIGSIGTEWQYIGQDPHVFWADSIYDVGGANGYVQHPSGEPHMQWVGVDGYNWAMGGNRGLAAGTEKWEQFSELMIRTSTGKGAVQFARDNKGTLAVMPVVVAELGCSEAAPVGDTYEQWWNGTSGYRADGSYYTGVTVATVDQLPREQWRARWITDFLAAVQTFPEIVAVTYFDQLGVVDHRLSSTPQSPESAAVPTTEQNPETIAAWQAAATATYFTVPATPGTETFTVPTARDMTLHLLEYRGIEPTNASDQGVVESGITATPSTGTTGVTSQAKELWLGFIAHRNRGSVQASPTNGFGQVNYAQSTHTDAFQAVASGVYERIVTATGTAGTSVTLDVSRPYAGRVSTFRSAGLPSQTIGATGIASTEAFGAPTSSASVATLTIAPASFYEHEFGGSFGDFGGGVGSPTLNAVDAVNLVGIPTSEAFGVAALSLETSAIITTEGVLSEEAFGDAAVTGGGDTIGHADMGIASEEAFGEPVLAYVLVGIPSAEAFGVPDLQLDAQSFSVEGIDSDADNGMPTFTMGPVTFTVTGVPSEAEFGETFVSSQQSIRTASIRTALAFGQLDVQRIRVFSPPTVEGNRNDMNYRPRVLMDRFWLRVPGVARGITIWRTNGIWRQGTPTMTELNAAELIYLGGHEYIVSEQAASELEAEGYVVA
ncbi:MAG: hypothetical protein H0W51_03150 [Euzebyales bacterium]|nr:hypothetical protein [Euzebyales bacterium]